MDGYFQYSHKTKVALVQKSRFCITGFYNIMEPGHLVHAKKFESMGCNVLCCIGTGSMIVQMKKILDIHKKHIYKYIASRSGKLRMLRYDR